MNSSAAEIKGIRLEDISRFYGHFIGAPIETRVNDTSKSKITGELVGVNEGATLVIKVKDTVLIRKHQQCTLYLRPCKLLSSREVLSIAEAIAKSSIEVPDLSIHLRQIFMTGENILDSVSYDFTIDQLLKISQCLMNYRIDYPMLELGWRYPSEVISSVTRSSYAD